jgi:hypothetical protein
MRALRVAAFAALIGAIASQSTSYVWESMYAPPYTGCPEIALSIACVSKNLCYLPGGNNGEGFAVFKYDGGMNSMMQPMNEPNMTMMILTVAAGGTDAAPAAAFGGSGILTISDALQYLSNGNEWLPSSIPFEFVWMTQSMSATDDGQHIISLGQGTSATQIMYSANAGQSFTPQNVNIPPLEPECTAPMYAAMTDNQTWYIVLGGFPDENNNSNSNSLPVDESVDPVVKTLRRDSPFHSVHQTRNGKVNRHVKTPSQLRKVSKHHHDGPQCGYTGQIAKTTDGGKTWDIQFSSTNVTMGDIDCVSATHCVATAYGVNQFNESVSLVLTTTDGNTWQTTLNLVNSPLSFQAVAFADSQEVWLGGGFEDQTSQSTAGVFYISNDGGMTWTQNGELIPDLVMIMDSDVVQGGIGFAGGMTAFKSSTILRYEKQSFAGYFNQAQCPFAGCSLLCQNVSFPQGMCMEVQGGSLIATCGENAIEQRIYQTTSCIGAYQTVPMPINTCINNSGWLFENYCNVTIERGQKAEPEAAMWGFFGLF